MGARTGPAAAVTGGPGRRRAADVVASWAAARVVVLGALALAALLTGRHFRGLLNWDAGHYLSIAEHGYPRGSPEDMRFFPLVPVLARAVGWIPGISTGAALLVVANAGAVLYALLLRRLARAEGMDEGTAGRAVWLLALAPPAFTLVIGYAESVYGALAVAFLAALRRRAWLRAAGAGFLAGTCRPLAVVLVAVALAEGARGVRKAPAAERLRRLAAVLGPAVGIGTYLAYIGIRTGSPLLPYAVQAHDRLRGAIIDNPLSVAHRNVAAALTGHGIGPALHVVWLLAYLALLVVVARTLPAGYIVLAGLTLLLAATSALMNSLERYAWSAFPFTLALAGLTGRPWVFRLVLTASTVGLVAYALLAFGGSYVP